VWVEYLPPNSERVSSREIINEIPDGVGGEERKKKLNGGEQ